MTAAGMSASRRINRPLNETRLRAAGTGSNKQRETHKIEAAAGISPFDVHRREIKKYSYYWTVINRKR